MQRAPTLQGLDVPRHTAEPIPPPVLQPFHSDPSASFESPWSDDDDDEFCSVGWQEFPVAINDEMTLTLLQAPTAFSGVQHDETGTVVWGASVCLARHLANHAATIVEGHSVLELGCGCGLPSLVAARTGASRVVATDMEDATLAQLDAVVKLNRDGKMVDLELAKLNWKNHDPNVDRSSVILASDVIYHEEMVAPLVDTIDRYLDQGGKAYLALRNTRQGVQTFWKDAMPHAGFRLIETISCKDYLKEEKATGGVDAHRFRGDHSIYVFQRVKEEVVKS